MDNVLQIVLRGMIEEVIFNCHTVTPIDHKIIVEHFEVIVELLHHRACSNWSTSSKALGVV